eukprot:1140892-Pelagomonas_calceolata.AAC.10
MALSGSKLRTRQPSGNYSRASKRSGTDAGTCKTAAAGYGIQKRRRSQAHCTDSIRKKHMM